MISWTAVSILSTLTWIHTFFLVAGKNVWAVWVTQTFIWSALPVGITLVILKAKAASPVAAGLTVGIGPTGLKEARVLTFSIGACFVIWAL
jgi:hypothetical protein